VERWKDNGLGIAPGHQKQIFPTCPSASTMRDTCRRLVRVEGRSRCKAALLLHPDRRPPSFLAGIWTTNTFAILTTAADGGIKTIHDRRAVVLDPPRAWEWINHREIAAEGLVQQTVPATAIRFFFVRKVVSNASKDGAELIKPITLTPTHMLYRRGECITAQPLAHLPVEVLLPVCAPDDQAAHSSPASGEGGLFGPAAMESDPVAR
jgi:hypothetical protein